VLALVVCTLALALIYPTRQYLSQRSRIAQLQAQTDAQQRRLADLKRQATQWQDPAYVRSQARSRLHYVMPGEIGLTTTDSGAQAGGAASPLPSAWYDRLWGSVQSAASPRPSTARPSRPAPAPAPAPSPGSPG
jgi:cell division protein FtsL